MNYTDEQQAVINDPSDLILVKAYAGCGKTSTLVGFANHFPNQRILYLAYNRSIAQEAQQKFPNNVTCVTSHSLAWQAIGKHYSKKLKPSLFLPIIIKALHLGKYDYEQAQFILQTLLSYFYSADETIGQQHCPTALAQKAKLELNWSLLDENIKNTNNLWTLMQDVNNHDIAMLHDGYLKLYQLTHPDLSSRFDILFFDECQDANPVTTDIVLKQNAKLRKVLVGDPHQAIYRFRGAVDAFKDKRLRNASMHTLSCSFRFGKSISHTANIFLSMKGETTPLKGFKAEDKTVMMPAFPDLVSQYTTLCRTVAGVIEAAIAFTHQNHSIYWVGGIDNYQLDYLLDVYHISVSQLDKVKDRKLLRIYPQYKAYAKEAEDAGDNNMRRTVKLIDSYSKRVPSLVSQLYNSATSCEKEATRIVSTAHRSKGLEWDRVFIYDDFNDIFDQNRSKAEIIDEVNLLYVSSTRAQQALILSPAVVSMCKEIKSRFNIIGTKENP